MTYLQLINRVLSGLREGDNLVDSSATSITDAYHLFIAELVNDFIIEVENAYEWTALETVQTYSHTASTAQVDIGLSASEENKRVRLMQVNLGQVIVPAAYDYTDATQKYRLQEIPWRLAQHYALIQQSDSGGNPSAIALSYNNSDQLVYGHLYPVCDTTRSISLSLKVPQGRLDPTVEADLGTNIAVPANTVALGAIWYALAERGEELGVNPAIAQERYMKSLADEIALDEGASGGDRLDIEVV